MQKKILFLILILALVSGCSSSPKILSTSHISQDEAFKSGLIRLDCIWFCHWKAFVNFPELQQLYLTKSWATLSRQIIDIGFGGDIAYFYLGSAAEGLGYDSAALTYYQLGNQLGDYHPAKCNKVNDLLSCQGHRFPKEFNDRIYALQNKKNTQQTIPQFTCTTNSDCMPNQNCHSLPGGAAECRDNSAQTLPSPTQPKPPVANSGIDAIQKKCIELGFETNTEKFKTCVEKSSK